MKSSSYKPAPFRCPFPGCQKACKKPGGLTQHKEVCQFNPKNQRQFSPLSRIASPFPWEVGGELPFRTPSPNPENREIPPTPSNTSPRRVIWETNGRSGIRVRKHPFLDGLNDNIHILDAILFFCTLQVHPVMRTVMICLQGPLLLHLHPKTPTTTSRLRARNNFISPISVFRNYKSHKTI